MRGDATNTECWRHHKIRVAENDAIYITTPFDNDSSWDVIQSTIQRRRCVATLQIVNHEGGLAVHGLVCKQWRSLGQSIEIRGTPARPPGKPA
eukprot:5354631-Pyramimonas_sp.AAC.1